MKKLFLFLLLTISLVAGSQSITVSDLDKAFNKQKNSLLFDNSVFSTKDTILSKTPTAIYSRLFKYQRAYLFLTKVNGKYIGRIFKNNELYYELVKDSIGYRFEKREARGLISNCPLPTDNESVINNDITEASNFNPIDRYLSDLKAVQSGWACVFIDMDGETVNNTSWNFNGPIICSPVRFYSYADSVNYVISRAREAFAPFRIVVTNDSTVYYNASLVKRIRIIMTPTDEWYGHNTVGGISFNGAAMWGDDTPSFAFFGPGIGMSYEQVIAASIHEAGHTWGLFHQASWNGSCVKTSDFNTGVGSGETGFAPIMGVAYTKNMQIWWNGPNTYGCTNYQYDVTTIAANSGGFVNRDIGDSIEKARVLSPTGTVNGLLSENGVWDLYKLNISTAGNYTFTSSPYDFGASNTKASLKVRLKLYQSDNSTFVDSSINSTVLDGTITSITLSPGIYYLRVCQAPTSDNPTGYGFLGHYSLVFTKD